MSRFVLGLGLVGPMLAGSAGSARADEVRAPGQYSTLSAVSCPSLRFCLAVGYYYGTDNRAHPLAERWDGVSWTAVAPASPSGVPAPELTRVSCVSRSECQAIGSNGVDGAPWFAERWDGLRWRVEPFASGSYDEVRAITCRSASFCIAVGANFRYAGARGTIWHWNGARWTRGRPHRLRHTVLQTVACPTARGCFVVASLSDSHHVGIEHWNGSGWRLVFSRLPAGAYLTGLSCPRPGHCTATGAVGDLADFHHQPKPVVANLSGRAGWSAAVLRLPQGVTNATFGRVSCTSERVCTATAVYDDSLDNAAGKNAVAVRGSTGGFHLVQRALPATLNDISCRPTSCRAVGYSPPYQQRQDPAPGPGDSAAAVSISPRR